MISKVEKIEVEDPSGILSNITDLLAEVRGNNLKSLAVVYARKDGSIRSFWSGWERIYLVSILEQLKFDILLAGSEESVEKFYEKSLGDDE